MVTLLRESSAVASPSPQDDVTAALAIADFSEIDRVFAIEGEEMRVHRGRSVERIAVDGRTHYLKRFWFLPGQVFKRYVARGLHELRMIDWLSAHGFAAPKVVARGRSGVFGFRTRVFFLMEEVPSERPFEAEWRTAGEDGDGLIDALAGFAARLHDAGFVHTDFSERHILTGRVAGAWTFRLIDVERAAIGRCDDEGAAADLKTLAVSVMSQTLRQRIEDRFMATYIAKRQMLSPAANFPALFAKARPTKSFK